MTVGLISAFSANFNENKKPSYNISIGPSFHPPGKPIQLSFAALVEIIDIGNDLGNSPRFEDRIRLTLYTRVPFSSF